MYILENPEGLLFNVSGSSFYFISASGYFVSSSEEEEDYVESFVVVSASAYVYSQDLLQFNTTQSEFSLSPNQFSIATSQSETGHVHTFKLGNASASIQSNTVRFSPAIGSSGEIELFAEALGSYTSVGPVEFSRGSYLAYDTSSGEIRYVPLNNITVGTASFVESASFAQTSISSSYALTSSYLLNPTISGSISQVDYIDFNTGSAVPAWKSGRVFWDNTDGALSVYNAEQDITLQVGQENWTRIYNPLPTTVTNGTVVRLSGTHGDVPEIERAQSLSVSGSVNLTNQILGVATHDIEAGTFGYITTQGLVRGLNTNAFNDGDTLFVSTGSSGALQNTAPRAPFEIIPVGVCVKASPGGSGIIYVAVQQPIDFSDLSSAKVEDTYIYGDLWTYIPSVSTGVWTHTNQLSGSYGLTGSLQATSFIGTLTGNASTATSASHALTASYVLPLHQAVIITGSLIVSSSNTFQNIGPAEFTGSVSITGSLISDFPNTGTSNDILVLDSDKVVRTRSNLSLQGIQGIQGTQGIQGIQGIQGTQGIQGIQGIGFSWQGTWSGATAYALNDVVEENGSTYISIQGSNLNHQPGTAGGIGWWDLLAAQGTQGIQGTQGTQGIQGVQGIQGSQGTIGTQGIQGIQGSQGTIGTQGIQGIQGSQGTIGSQGTQGT